MMGRLKPLPPTRARGLAGVLLSRDGVPAWLVFAVCLLLVAAMAGALQERRARSDAERFELLTEAVATAIEKRMRDHGLVLRSGRALFNASARVDRDEWQQFVADLELSGNYPGIQGVGFSKVIPAAEMDRHVQSVQAEGFGKYLVRPSGQRERYTSIVYLEPFAGRNLAAFGYDMYSEPVRSHAMDLSLSSRDIAISGKVRLLQETHGREQAGFLMYLPVFLHQGGASRAGDRWDGLLGWVFSPFRAEDLMLGIFGQSEMLVDVAVHDGSEVDPERLLYDSTLLHPSEPSFSPEHARTRTLDLFGRTWTLSFHERAEFARESRDDLDLGTVILGVALSVALFILAISLVQRRRQALELASLMSQRQVESDQRFRQLFAAIDQGVLIHGADGAVLEANPAAERMFARQAPIDGASPPLQGFVDERGRSLPPEEHPVARALRDGRPVSGVVLGIAAPDQRPRWFNIDVYPQSPTDLESQRQIYQVVTDVTDRLRLDRLKGEFVSTVSHELRTPLTAIRGALGLLSAGAVERVLSTEASELLWIAEANTTRLLSLVNDLLDLQKIESGSLMLRFERRPLSPLLQAVALELATYAANRDIRIDAGDISGELTVEVDPARFSQMVSNLLSNAIKFSPVGDVVRLSAHVDGDRVCIEVADRGPGVPVDFQPIMFQRFSQADGSDTRSKEGAGLGLAIVRKLVELHGGEIEYRDREGGGSCFRISLPLNRDSGSTTQEAS